MCGIAGFIGQGDEKILKKMADTLSHRGPDEEGFFIDGNIFLGHRRLSVIDLKTGSQPVFNEDKTIAVIFNGEIYNFQDLKKRLSGHLFKTNSDTEVLVHAYEEWGLDFIKELNGMFAFALWDGKGKKLILSRDRFGEKPLYWFYQNSSFIFASELKALMIHPLFKKEIDFLSLAKYFFFEYVPSPQSIFKNVHRLEPGHLLIFSAGGGRNSITEIRPYYEMEFGNFFTSHKSCDRIIYAMEDELEKQLDKAVKNRLISDVPLGVFLSGGIDSSTIAYFAQKNSKKPIKTFSIGFEESSFDESKWAQLVSRRLGTEHHEKIFSLKEMRDLIPVVFENMDEPLADASILPTYLLSKTAREKVKVVLAGDGGDEFWMGYPTFIAHKAYPFLSWLPAGAFKFAASLLPVSFENFSFDFKAKKFLDGLNIKNDVLRNQVWLSAFKPEELPLLLRPEIYDLVKNGVTEDVEKIMEENSGNSKWQKLVYAYAKHYLAEDILVKVDRASMMNSLEVRTPFLDHNLVFFINNLPDNLKLRGLTGKYLLKKLMTKHIGEDIVSRKKKGFGIPVAEWFYKDLKGELRETLSKEKIEREGLFNHPYIEKIMREHLEKRQNHRQKLWSLFVFQKWHKNFV